MSDRIGYLHIPLETLADILDLPAGTTLRGGEVRLLVEHPHLEPVPEAARPPDVEVELELVRRWIVS